MLEKIWTKINKLPKHGIGIMEWLFFAAIACVSYIFFCHQDILITASHSLEYLNGHITDFYSACKTTDGTYGANYLPTTFVLFAIWNIPMKLLGQSPEFVGDWSTIFTMWNKLLPTIAFLVCGILIYKLVNERLGFDKKKSMLTVFLMFTTPMAFFSQFFFCQYDIFTVMFMLIGMYYFFKKEPSKKDYVIFALSFGIASTFKYFALIILVILVMLKTKNILKIIIIGMISAVPIGIGFLFYIIFDRHSFIKSVFGFTALQSADGFSINLGGVSINLLYVALLVIIAFSYFTKPKDFDQFIGYSMFYSCGVCFALFGMMKWYPQWLLFMAPFWVLSIMINKHYEIFFWIDTLLGVALDIFCVNQFKDATDQALFRFGIFHNQLQYSQNATLKMSDIFVYKNDDTMFTLIAAVFLIGFIFKHPKFNFSKISQGIGDGRFIINVRFLAFTCIFLVGAFACLPNFLSRPDTIWARLGGKQQEIVSINNQTFAEQFTKIEGKSIEAIYAVCDEHTSKGKKATIYVDVIDTSTNQIVAHASAKEKNIKDGSHNATKFKLEKPIEVNNDTVYQFKFYTNSEKKVAIFYEKDKGEYASYYRTYQRDYSSTYSKYNGKVVKDKDLVMRIVGESK